MRFRAAGDNDGVQMTLGMGKATPSVEPPTAHFAISLWFNLGLVSSAIV